MFQHYYEVIEMKLKGNDLRIEYIVRLKNCLDGNYTVPGNRPLFQA